MLSCVVVTAIVVTASGVGRSWDGFHSVGSDSCFQDNGKGILMDLLGWPALYPFARVLVDVFSLTTQRVLSAIM